MCGEVKLEEAVDIFAAMDSDRLQVRSLGKC